MSMIVHPYLGGGAARLELDRQVPEPKSARNDQIPKRARDPFKDLPIRITFRTARVLAVIAAQPGASNRQIGDTAGVPDQGQISKLLSRLAGYGLIENHGEGHAKGEPNAWTLTELGQAIQETIAGTTPHAAPSHGVLP
jgi:DNA-binding MarR family transcriptional regulator